MNSMYYIHCSAMVWKKLEKKPLDLAGRQAWKKSPATTPVAELNHCAHLGVDHVGGERSRLFPPIQG